LDVSSAYAFEAILTRLFRVLQENTEAKKERYVLFPREMREELASRESDQSATLRMVCDYLASMTEGQALQLYSRLFDPTGGSPFELA
jgi:dGTPase